MMRIPLHDPENRTRRKYTEEEKKQLLANLDLEVAHRTRQMEDSLSSILENFLNHHEGQVLRVPRLVRGITMADFADKYNGDINECLRGLQRDKLGGEPSNDDLASKKRKWKESEDEPPVAESSRSAKNARIFNTPSKAGTSKARNSRLQKTPSSVRIAPPSILLFSPTKSSLHSRPASPSKPGSSRLPEREQFNPRIPKTPAYPRAPRRNEALMSINGSPLANPFQSRSYVEADADEVDGSRESALGSRTLSKRPSIIIRRAPSTQPNGRDGSHSRSTSQSSTSRVHDQHDKHSARTELQSLAEGRSQPSALMRVPTTDGLVLEFDPLQTSPEELDALSGISDSAKKQAKEDMSRLIQMTLTKWKIS